MCAFSHILVEVSYKRGDGVRKASHRDGSGAVALLHSRTVDRRALIRRGPEEVAGTAWDAHGALQQRR